jgi:hypothetical protein
VGLIEVSIRENRIRENQWDWTAETAAPKGGYRLTQSVSPGKNGKSERVSDRGRAAAQEPARKLGRAYLLYKKMASAIRTTVMIHRIVFLLLLLFSSAMCSSTPQSAARFKCRHESPQLESVTAVSMSCNS